MVRAMNTTENQKAGIAGRTGAVVGIGNANQYGSRLCKIQDDNGACFECHEHSLAGSVRRDG